MKTYRIGEVAASTGVTVEALRFYERKGVLPRPPRTSGGVRRYGPEAVERIRFVKQAQALGLTLRDIERLVGNRRGSGRHACERVHDLLARHVREIDRKMSELRALRATLGRYLRACEQALGENGDPACPTLDALEGAKP